MLTGKYVTAANETWHPEHFTCTECTTKLGGEFMSVEDKVYCKECATNLFAKTCETCDKAIVNGGIKMGEKHFHSECLNCLEGHPLTPEMQFVSVPDGYICEQHWKELYVKSCAMCQETITGSYLSVLEKFYHKACLKCSRCSNSLAGGKIGLDHEDKFLCSLCMGTIRENTPKTSTNNDVSINKDEPQSPENDQNSTEEIANEVENSVEEKTDSPPSGEIDSSLGRTVYEKVLSEEYIIEGMIGKRIEYLSYDNTLSYEDLKDNMPEGVNPMYKEKYLPPAEFEVVFKMSADEFEALPTWRQKKLKSELGLF